MGAYKDFKNIKIKYRHYNIGKYINDCKKYIKSTKVTASISRWLAFCLRSVFFPEIMTILRKWQRSDVLCSIFRLLGFAPLRQPRDFLVVNHQQMFRGLIASRFIEVSKVRRTKWYLYSTDKGSLLRSGVVQLSGMLEVNMEDVLVHLKAVFEACDQNGDGFVKTQDLLRLGQEHSSVGFEVSLRFLFSIDFDYVLDR